MSVASDAIGSMATTFAPTSPNLAALDTLVHRAEQLEVEARRLEAARLQVFADAHDLAMREQVRLRAAGHSTEAAELPHRVIRAELAAALRLSEVTIDRKLSHARALSHGYPMVMLSLRDGHISERHTIIIAEAGEIIGAVQSAATGAGAGADAGADDTDGATNTNAPSLTRLRRAAYEVAVLEVAVGTSPNRLAPIARRLAEQYAESSIDERHEQARQQRRVYVVESQHGMADLVAHLPAEEAYGILNRLTGMSKRLAQAESASYPHDAAPDGASQQQPQRTQPSRRTRDETRADLLTDLLIHAEPLEPTNGPELQLAQIRAQVQVVTPDHSLLGLDTGVCELVGYGPISSITARRLAGDADAWLLTRFDPIAETIIAVDRYRPSEEIRRYLRARDEHCRFPGCRVPVHRCDLDHTIDAALGGETSTSNLAHLCRGHHTLKHHGGWQVEHLDGGELKWKSPSGRSYFEPPPSKVRFTSNTSPPVPY